LVAGIGFAGLVFTVIYILWLVQGTLFGETRNEQIKALTLNDITGREVMILAPLAAAVLVIGFFPAPVLNLFQEPVKGLIAILK
jgi:NADH-quinone oxidoreductase subunit M